jgi:hypothetical protein
VPIVGACRKVDLAVGAHLLGHHLGMTSLVVRYESGDHLAVWAEIDEGRATPEESARVADLMMGRVSQAVDLIIERLEAAGWLWAFPDAPRRELPTSEDVEAVAAMEAQIGPLPAALRSCLLVVGGVFLGGTYPGWTFTTESQIWGHEDKPVVYADPLALEPANRLIWGLEDAPDSRPGEPTDPWEWFFSGDDLQKAGVSGGGDSLQMPFDGADPVLLHAQRPGLTLVEYLRTTLRFGGFPGFEFEAEVPDLIKEIAVGLPSI